ncbi:MAG: TetR/AcrR family transcriptional regulator [Fischerella sp.]|jgi:AcrR family transcriptional regulator|uniref:TetR/AcrR family transcriptional regulator n=1 Tax=Fischerella sp. TaxID=1191 RepID=UPI001853D93E|nr:TetR/AcrR family transcriptional regulator [Fischerella sp.]NWF60993.1 TetR/AcrR family transcriptional regulator [Fischerella sp.]
MSKALGSESANFVEACSPAVTPKQEQILQGAMRVFLKAGYAGTSMDRVSAEAGVSKQTIYSHFQDKEGLFKALMERVTIANFRSVFSAKEFKDEPAVFLRQLAETFFTKVADNPDYIPLLRLIVSESERFPELAKLYTQTVIQQGRKLLVKYFAAHPELVIADPEAIAQIFFGSLVSHTIVQEMLYGKELMPLSRDRLIDSLMSLVLARKEN